jgi:glucose-6-phosphate isomerase
MDLKAESNFEPSGKYGVFEAITKTIKEEIKNGTLKEIGIINEHEYYKQIIQKAEQLKSKYKNFYIIGLGGSLLGAKTIIDGLNLNDGRVKFIYYIQENFLEKIISKITEDDLIIAISKSGATIEVITILEVLLKEGHKNILGITANNEGKLAKICRQNGFEILKHEAVSGRFSYLTNVAILPCLLAGFNLEGFLKGARSLLKKVFDEKWNIFYDSIYSQIFDKNLNLHIMMPYNLELKTLTSWFCQIYAESLSRKEFKIMPYPSIGTIDQHSVLEAYLQNPEDKIITLIIAVKKGVLGREFELTKKICKDTNMKVRVFEFENLNEETLGFLMTFLAIEVIFIGKFIGFNPFIQEMIERRKLLVL